MRTATITPEQLATIVSEQPVEVQTDDGATAILTRWLYYGFWQELAPGDSLVVLPEIAGTGFMDQVQVTVG